MSSPADNQARGQIGGDDTRVAKNTKNRVGYALTACQVKALLLNQFVVSEDNIPQGAKEVAANALNHFSVHKGIGRAVG